METSNTRVPHPRRSLIATRAGLAQRAAALLLFLLTLHLHAQSPERALRDAVVQKQLYLKNFSAEDDIKAAWDGSLLRLAPAKLHALAAFIPASVEISSSRVRLHGTLQLMLHDVENPRRYVLEATRMQTTITIDLHGPDAAANLIELRNLLFFKDINDALHNVPALVRKYVPPPNALPKLKLQTRTTCDCGDTTSACAGQTQEITSVGWKAPVAISSLSDSQIGFASDQTLRFALQVEKNGTVSSVWVLHYAEGEVARVFAHSMAAADFKPGTCHDTPTPAIVEVNADVHSQ